MTRPSFITNRIRSSSLMSAIGSPATAIRSANFPGSIDPIRSCQPNISAALVVMARMTSGAGIPNRIHDGHDSNRRTTTNQSVDTCTRQDVSLGLEREPLRQVHQNLCSLSREAGLREHRRNKLGMKQRTSSRGWFEVAKTYDV